MTELLYLIDILGVTSHDFFDENAEHKDTLPAKQITDILRDVPVPEACRGMVASLCEYCTPCL